MLSFPGLPRHAADAAVVLHSTGAGIVIQSLGELTSADTRQPAAEVVGVGQLVGTCAMELPALEPAELVIRVGCQCDGCPAVVQVKLHAFRAVARVVGIGVFPAYGRRTVLVVPFVYRLRIPGKGVGGLLLEAEVRLRTGGTCHPPFDVIIVGNIYLTRTAKQGEDAARLMIPGVGLILRCGGRKPSTVGESRLRPKPS